MGVSLTATILSLHCASVVEAPLSTFTGGVGPRVSQQPSKFAKGWVSVQFTETENRALKIKSASYSPAAVKI